MGAGKSAVVTALFSHLESQLSQSGSIIHTTTRTQTTETPRFVYVDARKRQSAFALYHAILDALSEETIPEKGIGTERLLEQLTEQVRPVSENAIVAVDHVGEPGTFDLTTVAQHLSPLDHSVRWAAIGRTDPASLSTDLPPERIEIPRYRSHALIDVLTGRASAGLAERALQHEQTREIADWAEGNAHHAFAALFRAADRATRQSRSRIHSEDITDAMVDVPRPCESLSRVMALPANRQQILRVLVDLDESARTSVDAATEAIVTDSSVDLSAGTVKRFLYELAETGIVERIQTDGDPDGHGRPPSRVEPRFPMYVFSRLYESADG